MKCYGLIGKTLKHSFSKDYFKKKFEREKITGYRYDNYELKSIEELPGLINTNPDLLGLNITIPYKEAVLEFLDSKDPLVEQTGACNCIRIGADKKLNGYNTDVTGFKQSLGPKLKAHHKKALILGTGGAAKAVGFALRQLSIDYVRVSRSNRGNQVAYEELSEKMVREHTLIINTTPVGMFPVAEEAPPIPYHYLNSQHLLFDLIYNPPKTKFLEEGEQRGAEIFNGSEMLMIQAEESWRIWNQV